MRKLTWFAWLIVLGLILCPTLAIAQDDDDDDDDSASGDWITQKGQGEDQTEAIATAHVEGIMAYVKRNIQPRDLYDSYEDRIRDFVSTKWQDYTKTDPDSKGIIRSRFQRRRITIKFRIDGRTLLNDLKIELDKGRSKLEGMTVAIAVDPRRKEFIHPGDEPSRLDREAMRARLSEKLGAKTMTVIDLENQQEQLVNAARMYNLDINTNPEQAAFQAFADCQLFFYFWVICDKKFNAGQQQDMWYAEMGLRGVIRTSSQTVEFTVRTGDKVKIGDNEYVAKSVPAGQSAMEGSRRIAIQNLADICAAKVIQTISQSQNILKEGEYTLKLFNFSPKQLKKAESALRDMQADKKLDLKPVGSSDVQIKTFKFQWLRKGELQDAEAAIKGAFKSNQLNDVQSRISGRELHFEPVSSMPE